jgi:hypothetical protein
MNDKKIRINCLSLAMEANSISSTKQLIKEASFIEHYISGKRMAVSLVPSIESSTHELKTDSEVFNRVWDQVKLYEIRKNDRNFLVDDILILKETKHTGEEMSYGAPLIYTERKIYAKVLDILNGPKYGLGEGWCIMSIRIMNCK